MKLLTFKQLKLDGEECKHIVTGKVAVDAESIVGFHEIQDKFDVTINNALIIQSKHGSFLVELSFEEMCSKLEEIDFA